MNHPPENRTVISKPLEISKFNCKIQNINAPSCPNEIIPSVVKAVKLTLFHFQFGENNFPQDKWGHFSLQYKKKKYQFQPYFISFSKYLSNHFTPKPGTKEIIVEFKYTQSENAMDLVMKLLFGFKEVEIPEKEYLEVLMLLNLMGNKLDHFNLIFMNRY